jgi:PAS domain S-box-containing protein
MSELSQSLSDLPIEDLIPEAGASLASILCTEELQRRPSRPPDYEKENRALVALRSALADSPSTIFQTLADTILDITQCDSAGLSLLTVDGKKPDAGGKRFYWPAIAGMWNPHVGGGTPRNFGPCGDVLDQNRTLLFRHFERRYPYLLPVIPAAEECLLVPFYVGGKAVGTIWGIMHSGRRKFDAEDDRVMASLGAFAASAYQVLAYIDDLKIQIAERETAEAEAHELARGLEAKMRRLVEANVVGIVLWNLEGAITGANQAFLTMVQYTSEDIAAGRVRWTDLTPAEWDDCDERAIAALKTSGTFQPFEKEFFRRDGSRVPVLLGGTLFERGGSEGVAFVLDLTEQRRTQQRWNEAQEALLRTQAELAEVTRLTMMGELAGSIAHEINQPLATVVANAQACTRFLRAQPPPWEDVASAVTDIAEAGKRASDVIARIRLLLRKGIPEPSELRINDVIGDVVALTRDATRKRRVMLDTELAHDVPPVLADRVQLQQLLINLIINAADAMSEVNDRPRTLTIRSSCNKELQVEVAVIDVGSGIDPKHRDRIFDPFFTTKADGMGMGLAICRGIVEACGGRLWATSNPDCGTTVRFALPAAANEGV